MAVGRSLLQPMSVAQRSYPRDRARYPGAVGCLMWWALFTVCLSGYLVLFFAMSIYKAELGPAQACEPETAWFAFWTVCADLSGFIPLVVSVVIFISHLY